MSLKRKKMPAIGDVCAIPLSSGGYGLALCCGDDFAFFGIRVDAPLLPDCLQEMPMAFRVSVAKDSPTTGGWQIVGRVELKGDYSKPGSYLHKPIGSSQCYLYTAGEEKPINSQDCENFEILSTWFSFHVEERLEDYFAGRENKYLIAMKKQLGL